jgi:hypothetical protein
MNKKLQFIDHLFVLFRYTIPRLFQPVDRTIDECSHDLQNTVEVSQVSADVGDGAYVFTAWTTVFMRESIAAYPISQCTEHGR